MFNIPILLICFNRADHASQVLAKIVEAKPKDLYVFRDHWRENRPGEQEKCEEVLQMVKTMTDGTGINVHYLLPDHNLGCGPGPMTALNWFFSENEMGIILEDDAVPHPEFFPYCEELLDKYKCDESVYAIGSINIDRHSWGDGSYYFSMMNRNLCAWATWRRAWSGFDIYANSIGTSDLNEAMKSYGCGLREREYWLARLADVKKDALGHTSWDMQFNFKIWMTHGKGIIPNVNLSTNIGFDEFATHGANSHDLLSNRETNAIYPLAHPTSENIVSAADREYDRIYIEPYEYGWSGIKRLPYRLNKRIKRYFGIEGSWLMHLKI